MNQNSDGIDELYGLRGLHDYLSEREGYSFERWRDAVSEAAGAVAELGRLRSESAQLAATVEKVRNLHEIRFYDKWDRPTAKATDAKNARCSTCGYIARPKLGCPTAAALVATPNPKEDELYQRDDPSEGADARSSLRSESEK